MEYERQRAYDMQAGYQQGILDGIEQGNENAKLESAVIAVKEFNISVELAAEKFGVDLEKLKETLQS